MSVERHLAPICKKFSQIFAVMTAKRLETFYFHLYVISLHKPPCQKCRNYEEKKVPDQKIGRELTFGRFTVIGSHIWEVFLLESFYSHISAGKRSIEGDGSLHCYLLDQ